jgi:hypothetical protein
MKKPNLQKQLSRILTDLDNVSGYLEENNFLTQRDALDAAFEKIEGVQDSIEAL